MDIDDSFRPEDISKADFFDFVTASNISLGLDVDQMQNEKHIDEIKDSCADSQILQGYDQFWNLPPKDNSRLDCAIFEDLDRYCWQDQNDQINSSVESISNILPGSNFTAPDTDPTINITNNKDSNIYTLALLNGNEQWFKRESSPIEVDSLLSGSLNFECFSNALPLNIKAQLDNDIGIIKDPTEKCIQDQHQLTLALSPNGSNTLISVKSVPAANDIATRNNLILKQFQKNINTNSNNINNNNDNDNNNNVNNNSNSDSSNNKNININDNNNNNKNNNWSIESNNKLVLDQSSAESFLRSALQGKGYSGKLQLSNAITSLMPIEEKRNETKSTFSNDMESLILSNSTNQATIIIRNNSTANYSPECIPTNVAQNLIIDDNFLPLEAVFINDYSKLKKNSNDNSICLASDYVDIPMETNEKPVPLINSDNFVSSTLQHSVELPKSISQISNEQIISSDIRKISTNQLPIISLKTSAKKYKRLNTKLANNNNINNNNSSSNNNNNNIPKTPEINKNEANSLINCNGQKKERSLHYCSICSKGFKDKYSVNVHVRTHTGEKPFACSICGKSFRQKAHLAKHYQTHAAQKNNGTLGKISKNLLTHQTTRSNVSDLLSNNNFNSNDNLNGTNSNNIIIEKTLPSLIIKNSVR